MKTLHSALAALTAASAIGATVLMSGCTSTFQTRGDAEPSAFLGDVSQLQPGQEGEAKLVYVNPKANFGAYTKIILEPVVMVATEGKSNAFMTMSKEDQQAVVNFVDVMIRDKVGKDYAFVTQPGPDVMRLRVAITEAKGSTVLLDTLSSVTPPGIAINAIKTVATGTGSAIGKAGVEMELKDSVTGERLAAGVDERAGRKYTGKFDKFDRYHAIEDAFEYWATQLQMRLAAMRKASPIP